MTCEPETSVEAEEAKPLADERLALVEAMAEGLNLRTAHPVTLLAEAYRRE